MPCPTCDHTLAKIAENQGLLHYHCERCGTLVSASVLTDHRDVYRPKLVDHCRRLVAAAPAYLASLRRLGILESINLPEDRAP